KLSHIVVCRRSIACIASEADKTKDRLMSHFMNFAEGAAHAAPYTKNTRFQVFTERQLDRIEPLQQLSEEQRFTMRVVANVLPFRVNQYVIDELIDWSNVPDDPVFQLTFPQQGMLDPKDFNRMADALRSDADRATITKLAREIQASL